MLFYFNFLLFENYLRLIIWAILVSQALRQAKNNVVSVLQYLSSDPDVDRYVRHTVLSPCGCCCHCVLTCVHHAGLSHVRVLQVQ